MLVPGTLISEDYTILRPLAEGGMGSVYVVKQLSTDATRVLKVMQPALERDADAQRRFEREARIGSQIQSDHVIEVLAAGAHDGLRWIVMPQLEGLTLGAAVRRWGAPGHGDGTRIVEQLFHAVGAAHDAQIVHRDLKPENIFLTQLRTRSGGFSVKVLDFGIAKWLGSGTATGSLGTWSWAAPEQSLNDAAIGCYTDVWALGLLVFWLLTGRDFWHPAATPVALLGQVHVADIPRASVRARELGLSCELSEAFDRWFARCVVRDSQARFSHAALAYKALAELSLPWNATQSAWQVSTELANRDSSPQAFESTRLSQTSEGNLLTTAAVTASPSAPPAHRTRISHWTRGALLLGLPALAAGAWLAGNRARPGVATPNGSWQANPAHSDDVKTTPNDMARIAAAADSAGPQQAFWLDRREVTVEDYQKCVQAKECTAAALTEATDDSPEFASLCNSSSPSRAKHPINCVSWYQAHAYCKFADKRLPSEHEWRWAAEGSEQRSYPWGNSLPQSCDEAVVSGLCKRMPTATREVGTRNSGAATPDGISDLAGNVWEWVTNADVSSEALSALCGGGWDYPREQATASSRIERSKQFADVSTGFRCAREE